MIHKYDKCVITVTEWNWKCYTQFRKFLLYHTNTHPAVNVIFSVLDSAGILENSPNSFLESELLL